MNSRVYDITEDKQDTFFYVPIKASFNDAIEAGMNIIQGKYDFNYIPACIFLDSYSKIFKPAILLDQANVLHFCSRVS